MFQYLRLAATLKYYGFVQFRPCISDYPQPGCRAIVAAGNRELNFRVQVSSVREISISHTESFSGKKPSSILLSRDPPDLSNLVTITIEIVTWQGAGVSSFSC